MVWQRCAKPPGIPVQVRLLPPPLEKSRIEEDWGSGMENRGLKEPILWMPFDPRSSILDPPIRARSSVGSERKLAELEAAASSPAGPTWKEDRRLRMEDRDSILDRRFSILQLCRCSPTWQRHWS